MFAQVPVEEVGKELGPMKVIRNIILLLIVLLILVALNLAFPEFAEVTFVVPIVIAVVIFFRMLRIRRKP